MKKRGPVSKVPLVEAGLVLIAFGIAVFVAFYVWHANNTTDQVFEQQNTSSSLPIQPASQRLNLDVDKLPAGWGVEAPEADSITLTNRSNSCSLRVALDSIANSTNDAMYKSQQSFITAQQSAGFDVRDLGALDMQLATKTGTQSLDGRIYRLSSKQYGISYEGFGVVNTQTIRIIGNIGCSSRADVTTAALALRAISLSRPLSF